MLFRSGGHTVRDTEIKFGLAVTGTVHPDRVLTNAGARVGDALVLTKPIGSGTIMAAEMVMQARGAWVADTLARMGLSQGKAASLLTRAHAMTDVTGFGLAGHLQNIARASGVGVELDLSAIPLFDGAEALAAQGIRSTLFPDNRANCADLVTDGSPKSELLFDPQTAGGLLAAVAERDLAGVQQGFRDAGLDFWQIGRCVEGGAVLRLV